MHPVLCMTLWMGTESHQCSMNTEREALPAERV